MAGNKADTKPLTNTDTGRGLWPPAGGRRRCGVAKAMAFANGAAGRGNARHHPPPRRAFTCGFLFGAHGTIL